MVGARTPEGTVSELVPRREHSHHYLVGARTPEGTISELVPRREHSHNYLDIASRPRGPTAPYEELLMPRCSFVVGPNEHR